MCIQALSILACILELLFNQVTSTSIMLEHLKCDYSKSAISEKHSRFIRANIKKKRIKIPQFVYILCLSGRVRA
jgi:hypothetical protein